MTVRAAPETIPISELNALEYCPRRFYYQFVQSDRFVNEFLLEGTLLHQRVHEANTVVSVESEIQTTHLYLYSETLHLSGFTDVIEERGGQLIPVEYKRGQQGKQGARLNDAVQLCAQALCLEEQRPDQPSIPLGYIYYIGSRRRVQVNFTEELRERTKTAIDRASQIAMLDTPPPPLIGELAARCPSCSLFSLCLPDEVLFLRTRKGDAHVNALSD